MEVLLCMIIGFVMGVISTLVFSVLSRRTYGTLRVDNSDPEDGPYLFLELTTDVNSIKKRKRVSFKVNVKNYLSQK